ncbi:hypothetical protein A3SI_03985 [Nitritalea halalkaliphila LW7]|uniref:Uncharacterized protein n=1 Tax=Nitritalea halalkaliphila LW7 TaxID=1189621 RepID=I5C997_9BACT|nr:hypothetical protein [Nitritalea halalkaliphila]EIM78399.1 hypothetical protein A3SI_03985 [Nitritalea halalkaliphila LW7]
MKILSYSFLFLALLVVSACGPSGNSYSIRTEALELKAEGPLFEGSNMAQASWEFDVAELLSQNQIDGSTITRAQISGIQIQYKGEPIDMQKVVLEVTSKSVDMSRIASTRERLWWIVRWIWASPKSNRTSPMAL